jgi:hypothetical protein
MVYSQNSVPPNISAGSVSREFSELSEDYRARVARVV